MSNACRTILTCYIGYQVLSMTGLGDIHGVLNLGWACTKGLAWTIAIYFGFAAVAAIPGLKPSTKSLTELFGGWVDNLLEVVTLLTAVVLAVILVSPVPFLAISIVPVLVFVPRGVLYKHVEYLASTDDKTGLFNTEGWHFRAAETLTRAKRDHTHDAVLMADLDHFKRVNDLYGHLAGDAVLKAVAGMLSDAVELAELLQFLHDWLATDTGRLSESLNHFAGSRAYDLVELRADLHMFTFLLGATDGEGLFAPESE